MPFSQTFTFDRDFQIGIVALMIQDFEFLLLSSNLIQPNYFEDPILMWFFQKVRDYYLDYNITPDVLVLNNEMNKAHQSGRIKDSDLPNYVIVADKLHLRVDAKDYVIDEVVRFCRRQSVRKALLESAPMAETDDPEAWDKIEAKMREACNIGSYVKDVGIEYFLSYQERLRNRLLKAEDNIFPTGITELDRILGGGVKPGQLFIWLGAPGWGKSIALPHCGKRAVIGGHKAAHYTLELGQEDIAERYDSAWSFVPVHNVLSESAEVIAQLTKVKMKYGHSLVIKEYPTGQATVGTIRQHLNSLRTVGFNTDVVIVDYGDLLKPQTNYNDEYADQGSIFRDLRGLGSEFKVPVFTATQVNRPGMGQEIIDIDSVADSFRKVQIADIVVALCASPEELRNGVMRLYVAKNRNGPQKLMITIRTDYSRMVFYDPLGVVAPVVPPGPPPPSMPNGVNAKS